MTTNDIIKQDFRTALKAHAAGNDVTALTLLNECLNNGTDHTIIANAAAWMGLVTEDTTSPI